MEYYELFIQNLRSCKIEKQEKLKKIYKMSHAVRYYFDVINNRAMLNALLLKGSVAPGCVISFF